MTCNRLLIHNYLAVCHLYSRRSAWWLVQPIADAVPGGMQFLTPPPADFSGGLLSKRLSITIPQRKEFPLGVLQLKEESAILRLVMKPYILDFTLLEALVANLSKGDVLCDAFDRSY